MSATLSKTVVVGGTVYVAGDEIPDEVADKITAEGVVASRRDEQAEPEGSAYDSLKVDDLKAEIEKRNEGRDPDGDNYLSSEGKKAALVAALKADDEQG